MSKDTSRYVFIPVDCHEVRDTKTSFKKLCRACVPSAASTELITEMQSMQTKQHQQQTKSNGFGLSKLTNNSSKITRKKSNLSSHAEHYPHTASSAPNTTVSTSSGFFKQIQESRWFEQLQLIMNISNLVVDRMEEGASVMISLEEGWDLTTQVTSLAELWCDPYYRTIEGFSVLVEREWVSIGHRFSRRSNHTIDDQTGFAPVFLQFLDCVHQSLNQYPNAFEFNEFYLEFLAYHYVSNRFKTFLLDSELERVQFGLLNGAEFASSRNAAKKEFSLHTNVNHTQAISIPTNTSCIWQYILKVHYNSAKFFNFNYQPNMYTSLRPSSELYKLKLWKYYTKETLCTGPLYDLDLLTIGNLNNNNNSSGKVAATTPNSANNTNNQVNRKKKIVNLMLLLF